MEQQYSKNKYGDLLESIRLLYGHDFTEYAQTSIARRIDFYMSSRKIGSFNELKHEVLNDVNKFEEFVESLSVTVTEMFRDPLFYRSIRKVAVKYLATYPIIKIWIAGCATGEEVYSMAILLKEVGLYDRSIIYATDISHRSLQIAKEGIFPLSAMKIYTQNYLDFKGEKEFTSYYSTRFNSALFDKSLTRNVVFSPHNLVMDKSFNEFQLIICRNVLIYFNQSLQDKVFDLFYYSLCDFGYLGLGDNESMLFYGKRDRFQEADRKEKIFKKIK